MWVKIIFRELANVADFLELNILNKIWKVLKLMHMI